MRHLTQSRPSRTNAAFTLVEITVVLVILGLLAALAVPRMVGNDKRQFRLAVDQVADLLTMYAQRDNLSQQVVGISHDRSRNRLMLMVIDLDEAAPDRPADWRPDRYVEPVRFPPFMHDSDIDVIVDGDWIDASEWPVANEIGKARPTIEIIMRGAGEIASISLPPYGVSPTIAGSTLSQGAFRANLDLETSGRYRDDW